MPEALFQTHHVAMVSPIADFVVDVGSDGRILSQGTLSEALAHDEKLQKEVQHEAEELQTAEEEIEGGKSEDVEAKTNAGKLVVAEEIEEGRVGWRASQSTVIVSVCGSMLTKACSVPVSRKSLGTAPYFLVHLY